MNINTIRCTCAKSLQLCLTLQPQVLWRTRLLCPWNFPDKNTGVGCYFLLQGIFPTQGLNPHLLCLLHWQGNSLALSHQGSSPGRHACGQRQVKRWSTSLIIKGQVRTPVNYHFTLIRRPSSKELQIINAGGDAENKEPQYPLMALKLCTYCGKVYGGSLQIKNTVTT